MEKRVKGIREVKGEVKKGKKKGNRGRRLMGRGEKGKKKGEEKGRGLVGRGGKGEVMKEKEVGSEKI